MVTFLKILLLSDFSSVAIAGYKKGVVLVWITLMVVVFSAAGDINAASSAQANKTFLPWETHLFTRLLKYGKQSVI